MVCLILSRIAYAVLNMQEHISTFASHHTKSDMCNKKAQGMPCAETSFILFHKFVFYTQPL